MAKALGKDIKEFYDSDWGEFYHDDSEIETHNEAGEWALADSAKYELLKLGNLVPNHGNESEVVAFSYAFKKWLKARDTVTIVVTVQKDKTGELVALLDAHGYSAE